MIGALGLAVGGATACGGDETRRLDPQVFAMNSASAPFYDDGELTLYQTGIPVELPIREPTESERAGLSGGTRPFDHRPWVTTSDVRVQVTWTLANLDKGPHQVKVLVDPWNEFGRYVPGVTVNGDEAIPNLSGIEQLYELPGTQGESPSRVHQTFTYADMDELAIDFATAIRIITDPALEPAEPADGEMEDDPRIGYVNHTFAVENRHGSSPYTDRFTPAVHPALLGFDLALQTTEPANVALEFAIEIVDQAGDRVVPKDGDDPELRAPGHVYTLGGG